jgi:conjugal transfer mating pair stabilization protein TraN
MKRVSAIFIAAFLASFGVGLSAQNLGDYYGLGDEPLFPQAAPVASSSSSVLPNNLPSAPNTTSQSAASAPPVSSVRNPEDVRTDARDFATPIRDGVQSLPINGTAAQVYDGFADPNNLVASSPEEALAKLQAQAGASANNSEAFAVVANPNRPNIVLDREGFARANAIEKDPRSFVDDPTGGSASATCKPLPPSSSSDYYFATCNEGTKVNDENQVCNAVLQVSVQPGRTLYNYTCETAFVKSPNNSARLCDRFDNSLATGFCREIARNVISDACPDRLDPGCSVSGEANYEVELQCDGVIAGASGGIQTFAPPVISDIVDASACNALAGQSQCTKQSDVCSDSAPATRIVNGVSVTRSCWAWQRSYQCSGTSQTSDCGDLTSNTSCVFDRQECLDDPQNGACRVSEKTFRCPVPGAQKQPDEYICDGDLYCINGDCEQVNREPSTEFKDAAVALNTLGQAKTEFNAADFTLFRGTRETCPLKIFGIANCCAGKGVPLITPLLCSAQERALDVKDDAGLCSYVGTYCSKSVLGVCTTKRKAYCCFESQLSRILQEQGRPQIGKPWAKPKEEQCLGFTVDQFAQLDLSKIDFTEIYSEFTDAVKLPSEIGAAQQIQDRIQQYINTGVVLEVEPQ